MDSRARAMHDTQEIDRDHRLNDVVALCCRVACTEYAGVVDPHVGLDGAREFAACLSVPHVEIVIGPVDIRGGDVVASSAQLGDDGLTKAAASSRDDRARHQTTAVTSLPSTTTPPSLTV